MRGDTQQFTLSANGSSKPFSAGLANYLYVKDATGLIRVELWRDRNLVEEHTLGEQFTLKNRNFDEFRILDLSGSSNTVRILYGPGEFDPPAGQSIVTVDDSTPVDISIAGEQTVTIDDSTPVDVNLASGSITLNQANISNGATSVPDVSCTGSATTQVVTASASNVRIRVSNPSTNSSSMRVGLHSGVGAANGTPLPPGTTYETETAAGCWVYNAGSTESVAVEVETRT